VSLFARRDLGDTVNQLVPVRPRSVASVNVDATSALRSSAVWACLRLRADLLSTMPAGVYRRQGGIDVPMQTAPLFIQNPAGDKFGVEDWLYQTQIDLDRFGNCYGLNDRNGQGLIQTVTPVAASSVRIKGKGSIITAYNIDGTDYAPSDVWHERQYPLPGSPVGLSPIAFAAFTIGGYLSAQQFGLDWFGNGSIPAGRLKNTAKTINPGEAQIAKERFKTAVANRDLFVHGADWEYDTLSTAANESQFIETMNFGVQDIARFFGVPGDLIDAPAMSSAKITYANITQRHLQFLVMSLAPSIRRRERALTNALPQPQYVKFDTDSILRLDPLSLASMLTQMTGGKPLLASSEARNRLNLPPFTAEQLAEMDQLAAHAAPVAPASTPAPTEEPA
jgi:HK97 family phage portal protein